MEISCHCGATRQTIHLRPSNDPLRLCHCSECRQSSGELCTTYIALAAPPSVEGTRRYTIDGAGRPGTTLYFCATCGCHAFRSWPSNGEQGVDSAGEARGHVEWEVASGVVVGLAATTDEAQAKSGGRPPGFGAHLHVDDTSDGGLSVWLSDIGGETVPQSSDKNACPSRCSHPSSHQHEPTLLGDEDEEQLAASCLCGIVRFVITRPNAASRQVRSGFPDLSHPYASTAPELVPNPDDEKWWLRDDARKYLAGTCACRSCRLICGFEIQAWAFVPRANIFFLPGKGDISGEQRSTATGTKTTATASTQEEQIKVPLDFTHVHAAGVLQGYESSAGVEREFCPRCGATVFWHDKWRPELIDVSVGLLRAGTGARAEDWLDWWTGRVSFAEDAPLGRRDGPAGWAVELVEALETGMKR